MSCAVDISGSFNNLDIGSDLELNPGIQMEKKTLENLFFSMHQHVSPYITLTNNILLSVAVFHTRPMMIVWEVTLY